MRNMLMVLVAAGVVFAASQARAVVTVLADPGVTQVTTGLTTFSTFGDDMVGMSVTATFGDNSTETIIWAAAGAGAGQALGTGWSLAQSGSTFDSNSWLLLIFDAELRSLDIDAGLGDAVFDIVGGTEVTPGSALGAPFSTAFSAEDITATYSNQVALSGNPPQGDLYRNLAIAFDSPVIGSGNDIVRIPFTADTDNLQIEGDIRPDPDGVPEPVTATLSLMAMLGLGMTATRRRRA